MPLDKYKIVKLSEQGYSIEEIKNIIQSEVSFIEQDELKSIILSSFYKFVIWLDERDENKEYRPPLIPHGNKLYKDICNSLQDSDQYMIIALPRKFRKSYLIRIYIVWKLLNNPNLNIILVSETSSKSIDSLDKIRKLLTKNEKIVKLFGDDLLYYKDNNEKKLTLNSRKTTKGGYNVEIFGINNAITGSRSDIVIFDDVIGEMFKEATIQAKNKDISRFYSVFPTLEAYSKVIYIGTRWCKGDLIDLLIEKDEDTEWKTYIESVFDDNGDVKHPEIMNKEEIEKQRRMLPPVFFSAQYENRIIAEENQIFKIDEYKRYTEIEEKLNTGIIGVDLSLGEGGDQNALVVVGYGNKGKIYVVDAFSSNNILLDKFYDVIRSFYMKYSDIVKDVLIEGISGFKYACDKFKERNRNNNDGIPFRIIKSQSKSKNTRIQTALEPFLRTGRLVLPSETVLREKINGNYINKSLRSLLEELTFFDIENRQNKDDLIDALALTIDEIKRVERKRKTSFVYDEIKRKNRKKERYSY